VEAEEAAGLEVRGAEDEDVEGIAGCLEEEEELAEGSTGRLCEAGVAFADVKEVGELVARFRDGAEGGAGGGGFGGREAFDEEPEA